VSGLVEVSTTVEAATEEVFALVADLARMGEWSPETTDVVWLDGATEPRPGARFRGTNRHGSRRWTTTCTVVTVEPGRELSWRSSTKGLGVALWRYRFEPDGRGATVVTESTEDERGFLVRALAPIVTGVGDRTSHNTATLRATLARITAEAERASA